MLGIQLNDIQRTCTLITTANFILRVPNSILIMVAKMNIYFINQGVPLMTMMHKMNIVVGKTS